MDLNQNDVGALADYSRLALTEVELAEMTRYLNETVAGVLAPIRSYDLAGVEPVFHPIGGLANVVREDVPERGLAIESALENAGASEGRCFCVPAIMGDGGEA